MIKIYEAGSLADEKIFAREDAVSKVGPVVAEIIERVRREGDAALYDYTRRFDGAELTSLKVTESEFKEALDKVEPAYLEVLGRAAERIRAYHEKQIRSSFMFTAPGGVVLGQKIRPIEKVGLYVPGGTAAYPSSVLMDCVPAKLAGCPDIIMVTPPGPDGKINPAILAAARTAGVDSVFKLGGAQAIAALAYGTESVPAVYKIVGPGNAYVAEAKRQVFGHVAIDLVAGPSEILVLADGTASPAVVAADMLSQAEHDKMATAVLVTTSRDLAEKTAAEIERQLENLPRREIARVSIENNGKIILAGDMDSALLIANRIAPEHLELCVEEPFSLLDGVHSAGSVFLGRSCPEALGDYMAGPNHTLPTGGSARFASPLSVDDFVKKTQFTYYTPQALAEVKDDIVLFARKEGLEGHALSVLKRFEEEK